MPLKEIDVSKLVLSVLLTSLVLVMGMGTSVSADEIILKKEILQGWKYSVDSGDIYQDVGVTGRSLRELMTGNERAVFEMEQYGKRKVLAAFTGYTCGGIVAGLLIVSILDRWRDEYQYPLMVGIGVGVISNLYNNSATNHLREAVRVYNRDQKRLSIAICLGPQLAPRAIGVGSALRISF